MRSRPLGPPAGLPPALYVHGLGGSSQNWSALMPQLDGVVDCEALDLPGFGDSPPPDDGDYSVTGHARAVIRYLDAPAAGPSTSSATRWAAPSRRASPRSGPISSVR